MSTPDEIKISVPRHKNLAFTSAGDHSNLELWLAGERQFDLWVTYYGNQLDRYRDRAEFYNYRRGAKFPNLHYLYQTAREILDQYDAIIVLDDDIIIDARGLNQLFDLRERYDLWLLQPAFDPQGKISHPITEVKPGLLLRYVSFVEVTCPLFKKEKLDAFMAVYDPALLSWGVDWWFLQVLGPDLAGKVAVIDAIPCINPHDAAKGGRREIDRIEPEKVRIARWQEFATRYNIPSGPELKVEYGRIPAGPTATQDRVTTQ